MNLFTKMRSKIAKRAQDTPQQTAKAVIITEQLSCPDCAQKINKMVQGRQGVIQADVIFVASRVKVEYEPEQINLDEIINVIQSTGYKVLETQEG